VYKLITAASLALICLFAATTKATIFKEKRERRRLMLIFGLLGAALVPPARSACQSQRMPFVQAA
jgi:hypothetical protein